MSNIPNPFPRLVNFEPSPFGPDDYGHFTSQAPKRYPNLIRSGYQAACLIDEAELNGLLAAGAITKFRGKWIACWPRFEAWLSSQFDVDSTARGNGDAA